MCGRTVHSLRNLSLMWKDPRHTPRLLLDICFAFFKTIPFISCSWVETCTSSLPLDISVKKDTLSLKKFFFLAKLFFPISSESLGNQQPCGYSLALYWPPRASSHSWISSLEEELEQGAKFTLQDHVTY
uniref:Uncharacterized protein n=1 Tax=Rousettus aegyptiacus TaxID=9407 RepID=A0A7J8FJR3_ROUAE|nr:hypothetical protein HJG63_012169 [Rousettus aegyptiacus]